MHSLEVYLIHIMLEKLVILLYSDGRMSCRLFVALMFCIGSSALNQTWNTLNVKLICYC
jgi:hypothetical protein